MMSYIVKKEVKKRCNYEILLIEEQADKCYNVRNVKK
ncbi:MAG: hypothetical protein KatS3mg003_2323 [Candidatus Nitrosocaldaceae archaeon]|nr:MAG: hypothetical protein KatS3mg003_2323 [Candidatus Nitrosocaldaceae archaeon]